MKIDNTIYFKRTSEFITYLGQKHQKIEVLNLLMPKGCKVYLSNGLRDWYPCSYYVSPNLGYQFVKPKLNSCAIMLYEGDANLRTLLHEIGHFLDLGKRNVGYADDARDEIMADIKGTEYYKKITGKGIRIRTKTEDKPELIERV